uniref:ATPase family AAA domain-containing protein n=1 Tax=Kalanchoe fedtschenkoi TaxID=63787 RepID=A0A7N0UED0_KALFE
MAATRISACAAMAAAAAATLSTASPNIAYAEFRFNPFSSSNPPPPAPSSSQPDTPGDPVPDEKPDAEVAKGSFDADSLERGAKAVREMHSSPYKKQLFELMKAQEKTRQSELEVEKQEWEAHQARVDIERQLKLLEEQNNLLQKEAQYKAQMLRNEDELARKRKKDDHEVQRKNNADLVDMQYQSALKKEQTRIANEIKIQEKIRENERNLAEIQRKTIKEKALADADARVHEAKLSEETDQKMLLEKLNGEKEKWLAAINTTFSHIEGGVRALLTDRSKLLMTIGGATALAAGIYTTRFKSYLGLHQPHTGAAITYSRIIHWKVSMVRFGVQGSESIAFYFHCFCRGAINSWKCYFAPFITKENRATCSSDSKH